MSAISTVGLKDKGFDYEAYVKNPEEEFKKIKGFYDGVEPAGHEIMVRMLNLTDEQLSVTKGGILVSDNVKADGQWDSTLITPVGLVISLGKYAYSHETYKLGGYCKEGDMVIIGHRVKGSVKSIEGWTTLFIDAESITATVDTSKRDARQITNILK